MNIKLISKNNVGAVVFLLLIIAISQSRMFNFFIDSVLGRSILIMFILYLSYVNKILGVVGVLFIIIMFNVNFYSEGFNNQSSTDSTNDSTTDSTDASSNTISVDKDKLKQMIQKQISESKTNSDSNSESDSKAIEGFDILGLENNIKRGKQSNSISVNQLSRNAESISPYESSSFFGNLSFF